MWLAMRSDLIAAVQGIDAEIDKVLKFPASQRAADKAKELFAERHRVAKELKDFDVVVEPHPAVLRHRG